MIIQYNDVIEVKKGKKVFFFSIFIDINLYCKIFETQLRTILLFKTCLWQFWTFWVSETCLWQDGLYRGIYCPFSETAGVIWYFHSPVFSPRGENIVQYFHPGVKISLRYLHLPYDIFTHTPPPPNQGNILTDISFIAGSLPAQNFYPPKVTFAQAELDRSPGTHRPRQKKGYTCIW